MADTSLGKAVLELVADGTGLTGDLKTAEDKVRTAADLMSGVLAAVGIGFSLKEVIDETIKSEQEQRLLSNAVRSTGMAAGFTTEQLRAQQAVLQQATGVGDEAISSMQRTLMSFRNVHGEVFRQTIQLALDYAAATGGDATDATRKFGMALNDPVNGLGKLKMAGIAVTDELKRQIEALVNNGDLVGAQTLLLNEMGKAYGGAAVAARDTFGGALKALKEDFGNLFLEQEGLGHQLKDITEFITKTMPVAAGVLSGVLAAIRSQAEQLGESFAHFMLAMQAESLSEAISQFKQMHNPVKMIATDVAEAVLAYERATESIAKMSEENKKVAETAPVTAGKVKQAADEMAAAFAQEFNAWLAKTQAETSVIETEGQLQADAVKAKYDKMAADSEAYFAAELLKVQGNKEAIERIETLHSARVDAIQKARATAQQKQDLAIGTARLSVTAGVMGAMTTIMETAFGEQSAAAKVAAIAQATVMSFLAYANTLAQASAVFPPPVPQIMASIVLAAGLMNVAKIRGLETGGRMHSGETALVGEAGPELFTAPRSGYVVPNHELGGSGVTVVNNINVAGMDFSSPSTADAILVGIGDAAKRGTESAIPAANAFSDLASANGGKVS